MNRLVRRALELIATGNWRYFYWALWRRLRRLDFDRVGLEDLGLASRIAHHHMPTPGPQLHRVLKTLNLHPSSGILDFGCGKGAALIAMAQFPFHTIAGCDISPGLLAVAKKNMEKLGISSVRLYCCDARQFTDLDEYDHFYFFNPFPREVFESVMANVAVSLSRRPRKTTIIYRRPQCHDVVLATGLFEKVAELCYACDIPYYIYIHRGPASAG